MTESNCWGPRPASVLSEACFVLTNGVVDHKVIARSKTLSQNGCVGARFFREVGARVATNVFVRDLDLLVPNVHDGRCLEVVAEVKACHCSLVVDHSGQSIERRRVTPSQRCPQRRCGSPGPRVGGVRARARF